MCTGSGDGPSPSDGRPAGNGRTLGRGPRPGSYSPPDPGGRGNGEHEPNRPWWTFVGLGPRWARLTLAAGIIAFGATLAAACMTPPDDDRPGHVDTSLEDNQCADPDTAPAHCEDLAP